MTGRDLILYILQNNLEDEPVVKDGKFIGLLSTDEVAIEFRVGRATVKTWVEIELLDGVKIGNELYILPTNKLQVTRTLRMGRSVSELK